MHPSLTTPLAVMTALPILSLASGARPLAAINASAQWAWPQAGHDGGGWHPRHTPLGLATNLAAGAMWGGVMAQALRRSGKPLTSALAVTGAAAVLDYLILPRRLSPGWEKAMPMPLVATAFAAMAMGMMQGTIEA